MSKLIIFRHAQASFGSQNYDQLSNLGKQQSEWLGQHLNQFDQLPTRFITGSLKRHRQTAQGIISGLNKEISVEENSTWNEFEFENIIQSYLLMHPEARPKDKNPASFFSLLRKAMLAWSEDEIELDEAENWATFESRVKNAFKDLQQRKEQETIWLVTSGGVIAMLLSQILETSRKTMVDLNLQTRNSSMSEVFFKADSQCLMAFNQVPHLTTKERIKALTYA